MTVPATPRRQITTKTVIGQEPRISPLAKASALLSPETKGGTEWVPQPVNFSELAAFWNPYHRACVQVKVDCSVGLGWTGPEGVGVVDIPGNSNRETAQDVMSQAATDLEDTGNAHVELVFNENGKLAETFWLPSRELEVSKDHQRVHQVRKGGASPVEWPIWGGVLPEAGKDGARRAVLRVCLPGTWSTYYGQPQWLGCVDDLLLAESGMAYTRGLFDNHGIPGYLVTIIGGGLDDDPRVDADGNQQPDALAQMESFFEANYRGAKNAGKTFFLVLPNPEAKIEVQALQSNLEEVIPLGKTKADTRDAIISGHRVPPRLLSIVVSGQLGSGNETLGQLRIFRDALMAPRQRLWEAAWTSVLPFLQTPAAGIEFTPMDIEAYAGPAPAAAPAAGGVVVDSPADAPVSASRVARAMQALEKAIRLGRTR